MQELNGLLRQKQVLKLIPISASAWWKGVQEGVYPQPIKLSPKVTCWRGSDIKALIDGMGAAPEKGGKK